MYLDLNTVTSGMGFGVSSARDARYWRALEDRAAPIIDRVLRSLNQSLTVVLALCRLSVPSAIGQKRTVAESPGHPVPSRSSHPNILHERSVTLQSKATAGILILLITVVSPIGYADTKTGSAAVQAGHASFDSADRQAVLNLVSSYGPLYDDAHVKEWRDLFIEAPVIEFWGGEKKLVDGIDVVLKVMETRHKEFKAKNLQRRHYLIPRVISQDSRSITGDAYLLLLSNDGAKPTFVGTGRYEFTAMKQGDAWRISRWIAHFDNSLD